MKKVETMTYPEIKRECGLRGVFKMGMGATALKNALVKHRDENPHFVLDHVAKTGKTKAVVKSPAKKIVKKVATKKAKKKVVKKSPVKKAAPKKAVSHTKQEEKKSDKSNSIRSEIMGLMAQGLKPKEIKEKTGHNMNTIYGTGQHFRALKAKK